MKKYISAITAIMLVTSLAACESNPANNGSVQTTASTAEQTTADETEQSEAEVTEQSDNAEESEMTEDTSSEKTDGDTGNTPPDMPEGGTPPDKPDGEGRAPGGNPPDKPGEGGGGFGGGSSSEVIYGGSTEITSAASEDGKSYTSDTSDQSALMISTSDDVTVSGLTVTKTGGSDGGDNCNFYGQNALYSSKAALRQL